MKYPIDTDSYISDLRKEFGLREDMERLYRRHFIPLVNEAYQDGINGCWNGPMDLEEMVAEFSQNVSWTLTDWHRNAFKGLITWCNDAYAQGQQDAKVK